MTVKDWINFPRDTKVWGLTADAWLNELVDYVNPTIGDFGTLPSSVANYGTGFRDLYIQRVGNVVLMGGMLQNVSGGAITAGTGIITLPSGFRPEEGQLIMPTVAGGAVIRATITTAGVASLSASWANNATWSFEGMTFHTTGG